jgi:RNA polymerase sigma factor (sigma-70 family)
MTDQELLRAFVERRDDAAFREIVNRYVHVVYASARRQVGNADLADDVTQAVFIMLARKAATLREGVILAGWLITSARFAAKAAARAEGRRKRREEQASAMNSMIQPNDQQSTAQPHEMNEELDLALSRLRPTDRAAVTLRFLQSKPLSEVAQTLGINEAAAAKRVSRAVGKLRNVLSRRGFMLTPVALIEAMEKQAQVTAPPALANTSAQAVLGETSVISRAAEIAAAALLLVSHNAVLAATMKLSALLLVLAGLTAGVLYHRSATPPPPPVVIQRPPIKVGVYVSLNTALKRSQGAQRNWNGQFNILTELEGAPELELIPLIEPGSESDARLMRQLQLRFPRKVALDVTDPAALRTLDVIIACHVCLPLDEALAAIDSTVRGGTGLLIRQCLGGDNNGYARPVVRDLKGLAEADPDAVRATGFGTAEIIAPHPLLGTLSSRMGQKVAVKAFGAYGVCAATTTPLLHVKTLDSVVFDSLGPIKPHDGFGVFPLTVGQHEKGRIVGCAFSEVPTELETATNGKFSIRAIRWAAGRPLD